MRIFLDASCWVAAAGSTTGGSALILKMASAGIIHLVVTQTILQEAERNIQKNFPEPAIIQYYQSLGELPLEILERSTFEEEARWEHIIVEKDRHVLAAAYKGQVDFLVSLDRKHILSTLVRENFSVPVMDTREFLQYFTERPDNIQST